MKYLINQDHPHLLNMGDAALHDQAHFLLIHYQNLVSKAKQTFKKNAIVRNPSKIAFYFSRVEKLRENVKTCVFDRFHGKLRFHDNKHV